MVCGPGAAPSRGPVPVHTGGPIVPSALVLGVGVSSTARPVERSLARGCPGVASTAGKLIAAGAPSAEKPSGTVYHFLPGAWTMKMGLSARPMAVGAVAVGVASGDPADRVGVAVCGHEATAGARGKTRGRFLRVR